MLVFISRLILLLIAVSAIRSVASFIHRLWFGLQQGTQQPQTVVRQSTPQGAATVLQQDPVCGTYVAIDSSLKRIVSGRVIHFCSSECRDRYVA